MLLRKLAATWEFHDASREIKSAVIQNCLSKRLQRYTLQQDNNKSISEIVAVFNIFSGHNKLYKPAVHSQDAAIEYAKCLFKRVCYIVDRWHLTLKKHYLCSNIIMCSICQHALLPLYCVCKFLIGRIVVCIGPSCNINNNNLTYHRTYCTS